MTGSNSGKKVAGPAKAAVTMGAGEPKPARRKQSPTEAELSEAGRTLREARLGRLVPKAARAPKATQSPKSPKPRKAPKAADGKARVEGPARKAEVKQPAKTRRGGSK